jgi:hypothetical protein
MAEPFAQLAECFQTIARRALCMRLHEAARIAARGDPNGRIEEDHVQAYKRALADVCAILDQAVTLCTIDHAWRQGFLDAWIRTEARFWLYQLPPAARREKLLDPAPGPQRFVPLALRREMLAEIDVEARRAKRTA